MTGASKRIVERVFFAAGDKVYAEGEPSTHAFFVQKGAVLLSVTTDKGVAPHSTVRERQIFGEMALIEEKTRAMSATAIVDTTCIVVFQSEFRRKLEMADPLIKALLRVLARSLGEVEHEAGWDVFMKRENKEATRKG